MKTTQKIIKDHLMSAMTLGEMSRLEDGDIDYICDMLSGILRPIRPFETAKDARSELDSQILDFVEQNYAFHHSEGKTLREIVIEQMREKAKNGNIIILGGKYISGIVETTPVKTQQ